MAQESQRLHFNFKNANSISAIASVVRFNKQLEKQPADQLPWPSALKTLYGDTAEM